MENLYLIGEELINKIKPCLPEDSEILLQLSGLTLYVPEPKEVLSETPLETISVDTPEPALDDELPVEEIL